MPERQFTISVVIPAYNAGNHIERAVASVLAQTRLADEIIVIDDGSTDNTREVISLYGNKVRYLYQTNAGPGAARNTGIQAATGHWVAFLDADDEWLPEKLQWQCELLKRNSELVWVSGNYLCCFCGKQYRIEGDNPNTVKTLLSGSDSITDSLDAFVSRVKGYTGSMLIQRDVLLETGLFQPEWKISEDTDLWLRIAYRYPRLGYVPAPVSIYHMEIAESLSRKPMSSQFLEAFLIRHLGLASAANRLDQFRPYAALMLRDWIRSAFFDDRVYAVREMLKRFDGLLPRRYRCIRHAMTALPTVTKKIFQGLSWCSRTFRLRRQTWHPSERFKRQAKSSSSTGDMHESRY